MINYQDISSIFDWSSCKLLEYNMLSLRNGLSEVHSKEKKLLFCLLSLAMPLRQVQFLAFFTTFLKLQRAVMF
jgi:hypothetical protein